MNIKHSLNLKVYFFIFLFLHLFIFPVQAADFKTSYNVEYYIQDNDPQGYTKASYTIRITNLQPDLVIKKFTLSFPKSFGVGNMVARDERGPVVAVVGEKERATEMTFEFGSPHAGLNEVNTLYLDFLQKNIFRSKGAVWEVFIPTLDAREGDTHSVAVYLPPGQHRKLSIAKPVPSHISFDKVEWAGDTGKSIYAVFGDEQRYALNLSYHLVNPNVYPVYTDIAFPPDTAYQKIIVNSIIPPPEKVYSDADGNFMARYSLKGNTEQLVQFIGTALVYASPRRDYREHAITLFESQQRSLFDAQPLWKLTTETPVQTSAIKDHYDYTLNTLSYNFKRIIKGNSRMGASQALLYPDQAVCTEYSDLLIASARQRGIYIREVQGFAFASEQELRPVQEESDILHSWVEYYNQKTNMWVPLDPTWEDTSGIDYFNSFDFNHIVFALHGKKADYPYPAGSYKSTPGGRDIRIEPTTKTTQEIKKLSAQISSLPLPNGENTFTLEVLIRNEGNTTQWDIPVGVVADHATVAFSNQKIKSLLPGEVQKISVPFTPSRSLFYQTVAFTVSSQNSTLLSQTVQVPTILSSMKHYALPLVGIIFGSIVLIVLFKRKGESEE